MQKESDPRSFFASHQGPEEILVCFLALNIDYLSQEDLITCLRRFHDEVFSLSLASHDVKTNINNLIDNRAIKRNEIGLSYADNLRAVALLKALNEDHFVEMAEILQDVFPKGGTIRGGIGGFNFYTAMRDLQISIFRNDPIEDISKTLLDLYELFPEKCMEVHPLFSY